MTNGDMAPIEQAIDKAQENLNAHGYDGIDIKDTFLVGIGYMCAKVNEGRSNEITINLQGKKIAGVAATLGAVIAGVIISLIGS